MMSDANPKDQALRELLRRLGPPQPDAEFARHLRGEFVRGEIRASGHGRRRRLAPRRIWLIAAAAGLVFFLAMPRQPEWRLHQSGQITQILLDGRPTAVSALAGSLTAGASLQIDPDQHGQLELIGDGALLLQLDEHVAVTLPARGRLPWQRNLHSEVSGHGVLRVTTGPDFAGQRLKMQTESAIWQVTGTTFAAIVHAGDVCLCVLEGSVRGCREGDPMHDIPAGKRMTVNSGALSPDYGDMLASERDSLLLLRSRAAALWD